MAATKLQDGDELAAVEPLNGETDVILQTDGGVFLRFMLDEIPTMKKASRGVRGIRLNSGEKLEKVYLLGDNSVVEYKGKNVHLNRLKIGKRTEKEARHGCRAAGARALKRTKREPAGRPKTGTGEMPARQIKNRDG